MSVYSKEDDPLDFEGRWRVKRFARKLVNDFVENVETFKKEFETKKELK